MIRRFLLPLALTVLALAASGCGRTEPVAATTDTASTVSVAVTTSTTVPATTTTTAADTAYVVQPGDSVGGIASAFGLTPSELAEYNELENPDKISVGQQLRIPAGATSTSTTPTTAAAPPAETETTAAG